jgi:hypothetical protein
MTPRLPWWAWLLISLGLLALILFLPLRGESQVPSVTLDWTSPGDDNFVGTATSYEMRFSQARPDTSSLAAMTTWWNGATVVSLLPAPVIAGTPQSVVVPGTFLAGETYYFIMKACDEVPNCSSFSNVAIKIVPDATPPSRIIDLIAR